MSIRTNVRAAALSIGRSAYKYRCTKKLYRSTAELIRPVGELVVRDYRAGEVTVKLDRELAQGEINSITSSRKVITPENEIHHFTNFRKARRLREKISSLKLGLALGTAVGCVLSLLFGGAFSAMGAIACFALGALGLGFLYFKSYRDSKRKKLLVDYYLADKKAPYKNFMNIDFGAYGELNQLILKKSFDLFLEQKNIFQQLLSRAKKDNLKFLLEDSEGFLAAAKDLIDRSTELLFWIKKMEDTFQDRAADPQVEGANFERDIMAVKDEVATTARNLRPFVKIGKIFKEAVVNPREFSPRDKDRILAILEKIDPKVSAELARALQETERDK